MSYGQNDCRGDGRQPRLAVAGKIKSASTARSSSRELSDAGESALNDPCEP